MLAFGAPPTRAPEPTGFLQLEDGSYLLNEEGGRISLNALPAQQVHGLAWAASLIEDGSLRLFDIAYANGKYVAVGAIGISENYPAAFISTDGITWQQINFPFSFATGAFFTSVVYANGNWVLIATTSNISAVPSMGYTSADLVNWTSGDIGLNAVTALAFNGTRFIATSRNDYLFQSTTLTSWTPCLMSTRQISNNELTGFWYRKNLRVINGYFFALNHFTFGVSNYGLHRSVDGITWERVPVVVNGTERLVTSLSYVNGRYYGTASGIPPYYSSDLLSWTAVALTSTYAGVGVEYTDGTYLGLVSVSSGNGLLTSQDGIAFKVSRASVMPPSTSEKILAVNGTFVVLNCIPGSGNPHIYTSL